MAADPPPDRPPLGGGKPVGGAFGTPGAGLPGGVPTGLFSGPPGGISGPPGGVAPPALAPLTLLAPLPGAMQAGGLAPPPAGAGGRPGGAMPLAGTPSYLPGAGAPLALPDLAAATRQALESVVEQAQPAATVTHAPHAGAPRVDWAALPPAPAPGSGTAPPPPGLWRGPPPAPSGGQIDRAGWHDAQVAKDRDLAQRIGDGLYGPIRRLRQKPIGWIVIVALFGLTVPIILLRQSFDARLRLVLAALTFLFWLGLVQDIG